MTIVKDGMLLKFLHLIREPEWKYLNQENQEKNGLTEN